MDRLVDLDAEAARAPAARRPSCSPTSARCMRSATRRCCAPSCRSRSIRRRSAWPASTMRAREARSSPSSAPFSTASSVADAAARTSSGSAVNASSITIAATGSSSRSTDTHAAAARRSAGVSRVAGRLPEGAGRRLAVGELQPRVVERLRHRVAPLLRRRLARRAARAGCGAPCRRSARPAGARRGTPAAGGSAFPTITHAIVWSVWRSSSRIQALKLKTNHAGRSRSDVTATATQRPALRLRRPQQAYDVEGEHGRGERQRDVDLRLARDFGELWMGADLEGVRRALRSAARQRSAARDDRREERPRQEGEEGAEPEAPHRPARRARLDATHRERQEQVDREQPDRRLDQHAEVEDQRPVGALPRHHPDQAPRTPRAADRTGSPAAASTTPGRPPSWRRSGSSSTARRRPAARDGRW